MKWLERHRIFLYQNYLLYAIAFLLPCAPRLTPMLILGFGVLSIYAIVRGYSRVQMTEVGVFFILFFCLHLLGMTFTENQSRGWFDLQVKLSLIAFPIMFIGFKFLNKTNFDNTLRAFLYGTLAAGIFCLAQSAYSVLIEGKAYYYFLTSRFSVIIHQSYFSMYLVFSIIVLAYLEWPLFMNRSWKRNMANALLLVFFTVCVVLSGSKIGMISWFAITMLLTWALIREFERKWIPILGLIIITSLIGVLFQSAPLLQSRVMNVLKIAQGQNVAPDSKESTAVRTLVYSSSWSVIAEQPWYGQGTGDFQDALDAEYLDKDFAVAAERHLNAHNLFLQTWISLGIPGVMTLTGIFLLLFQQAFRHRNFPFLGFTLLFLLISLTESALNMQAGVVFFAFFAILFARRTMNRQHGAKTGDA